MMTKYAHLILQLWHYSLPSDWIGLSSIPIYL